MIFNGAVKTARNAKGVFNVIRGVNGGTDKPSKGGIPSGAGLGVQNVFVVNMPGAGMGGGKYSGGKKNKRTPKTTPKAAFPKASAPSSKGALATSPAASRFGRVSSAAMAGGEQLVNATILYPIVDMVMDAAIGDTDFGRWAKNTTLNDVFASLKSAVGMGEPSTETTIKDPAAAAEINQKGIEDAVVSGLTQGMAALSLNVNVKQSPRVGSGLDVRLANGPTSSVMGG